MEPADFSPLVFESFGRLGASSAQLLRRLASRAALDRRVPEQRECLRWLELLSARLAINQADILLDS